ncbi:MAG TPA: class I SAM-dependent methyltransferase [Thermoanaerobaculia bacterium]|nr:class I SAM-dependent methyltransferase [Thermoanaerobaculia bacterium]
MRNTRPRSGLSRRPPLIHAADPGRPPRRLFDRSAGAATLLLLALAGAAAAGGEPAPASSVPPRRPAAVLSFHGADWLEREGREAEEKPSLVVQAMELKDGDVVAEVGCGTGYFSRLLARAVAPSGKVYAEDIQPEMLRLLEKYAARDGLTNIVPILGTDVDPKLPKASLRWVLLADVYHEFQHPEPMLARIRESLAPGGRVALVEYRLEGTTAAHVKPEHRMSIEQVVAEWTRAGFTLVKRLEILPAQHLFIWSAWRGARPAP